MYRLSKPQTAIYEMDRFGGGSIAGIAGDMFFERAVSAEDICTAVNCLLRDCETLRTLIVMRGDAPMQEIAPFVEEQLNVINFDSLGTYAEWVRAEAKKPVDIFGRLYIFIVVRVCGKAGLFCNMHHIIGDAWTMGLIAERLCEYLDNGTAAEVYPYASYIETEDEYASSKRYAKDKAYWLSVYDANSEVSYLSEKQIKSNASERKHFSLTKEQSDVIKDYCRLHDVSEYVLFLSAVSAYFYRVTDKEQFYIGTPVINRSTLAEKNTVGTFINTIPLSLGVGDETVFAQLCERTEETVSSAFRHQKLLYSELLKTLRAERGHSDVLFDVVVSYQNMRLDGGATLGWHHCGAQTESLQIHVDDRNGEGVFHIDYDYQTEKYTKDEIERMYGHMLNLLFGGISAPEKKVCELDILSDEEYQKVIYEFNDTAVDYPKDKTVHQLFEEQVERTPDRTALCYGSREFTYSDINSLSNSLAYQLISNGVSSGDIVGLVMQRTYYIPATILAILKVGAAYLPVDPNYPKDRINYIVDDARCKIILTYGVKLSNDTAFDVENLTCIKKANPNIPVNSNNVCAIIYTSGSTGKPKGTMLNHRGIVNYAYANHALYDGGSCIIGFSTYTFDAFFLDTILPLMLGKRAVMATESEQYEQSMFENVIKRNPICNIFITPTKLKQFFNNRIDDDFCRQINKICIGGEIFPTELLSFFNNTKIFNVYGPTECSMWVSEYPINDTDITIGKPIANTQIYILDKHLKPVPIGVPGELCIAGDCVGAGYLNRPELTAEKFIPNPFGKGKMYKTGDIAKWRADGNIEYIGRNDFQVKIRGLRIELGEIENAISGVEGISQAVAVVRKDNTGRQLICAFYTGKPVEPSDIRAEISKKLPKYMLPHIFTHLEKMPMTSSGKISRTALPELDLENISSGAEYEPPVTETEKKLCGLMAETLKAEKVGLNDDFFELGGDSLKAIEFVSKAHAEGIYFALQNVFDCPTVKLLYAFMALQDKPRHTYSPEDFTELHRLLASNKDDGSVPERTEVGNVLIAGATGFLGIHILAEYLESETGTAYCLVRGHDDADARARFEKLLEYYFGGKYLDLLGSRIFVLCGDVQKENLALPVLPPVQTIINAAASVKHYGSYKYFYDANVQSVRNMIDAAKKLNARFLHTSTLSVSGNSFADEFDSYRSDEEKHFGEKDLFIGQPLDNVYARSKFEAEKLVLEEMRGGLNANIFRMGNLTNRASDGMFQKNYESNAFVQRVKGIIELGQCPDYLLRHYVEFTPIDEAAKAVMTAARHFNTRHNTFHINSTKVVYIDRLMALFGSLGVKVEITDGAVFTRTLREAAKQSGTEYLFETFINDMDENEQLNYDSNIRIDNDVTADYLRRIGFEWGDIGEEYLSKWVRWFRDVGYWRA